MTRGPYPLPPTSEFVGAGVYALFYTGDFPLYLPLKSSDASHPIYVGKAVPGGARKGKRQAQAQRMELHGRLKEHAASIRVISNLAIEDFLCRYLVVTPLWITMAERFLIEHYQPLWNVWFDGFGNHDPGGRRSTEISWWDALHPGRTKNWKARIQISKTMEDAEARVISFLSRPAREREELAAEAAEKVDQPIEGELGI